MYTSLSLSPLTPAPSSLHVPQDGGSTGVWHADRTTPALSNLQALHSTLTQALQGSGGQSFRLQMVDEVVTHSLLPLLRGETQMDTLPPPPPMVERTSS